VHPLLPFPEAPTRFVLALVGVALLVAGRRLFWLAVGALGFVAGYQAIERWASELPPLLTFAVAVAVGIVGLVLAIVVQRVAVALAGFFLGVVLASLLLPLAGLGLGAAASGLVVLAAGVVMALVALGVFSLALVVLTAGAGASLLVQAIAPPDPWGVALLVVLWVIGVVVQRRTAK
jgi:hypothetical protein